MHPSTGVRGNTVNKIFVALALIPVVGVAQEDPPPPPPMSVEAGPRQFIEEIMVTARKREESLQEVPLAVSAFSGEQLQERGVTDNYQVALFTPNFNTVKRVGRQIDRPTVRGMANPEQAGEPNASYFVDGVFVSSVVSTATTDVVERVEVLRGPQSAQFGRATFAGAINYVTRKPTRDWEGQVFAKGGSDDDYKFSGWFSGPIIEDKLAFLVSGAYVDFGGAWRNNLRDGAAAGYDPSNAIANPPDDGSGYAYSGPFPPVSDLNFVNPSTAGDQSKLGGETTTDLLLKMTWTPTYSTEVNFKYSWTESDDDHWPALVPQPDVLQANCFLPGQPGTGPETPGAFCGTLRIDGYENRINLPDFAGIQASDFNNSITTPEQRFAQPVKPGIRHETERFLLDFGQDINEWELIGRLAYNTDEFNQGLELDHTHVRVLSGLFHLEQFAEYEDYSVEFRLSTPTTNKLRGTLGVYYYDFERDSSIRQFVGPYTALGAEYECPRADGNPVCNGPGPFPVTTAFTPPTITSTENTAIFGLFEWDMNYEWTLAVEARWAEDKKSIVGSNDTFDSNKTDAFTPRFTLRYTPNEEMMFYALAAKGNKPADFNDQCYRFDLLRAGTQEFCRDLGRNAVDEEEQWTYELGAKTALLGRRVTMNVTGFYIDWSNQAFIEVACTTQTITGTELCSQFRRNLGSSEIYGIELESNWLVSENLFLIANYGYQYGEIQEGRDEALLGALTGNSDLKGKEIPTAPNHSLVVGFVATNQVTPDIEGFLRTDYIFESEQWVQAANVNKIDDRNLVNLRFGVQSTTWTLTAYVNNLLDDDTPYAALDFFDFGKQLSNGEAPKLWALNPQRPRHYGIEFTYRFGLL